MKRRQSFTGSLALLIVLLGAPISRIAWSQVLSLEGSEFQVNETPFGPQWHARVESNSQRYLVVWAGPSDGPDVGLEIFGRIVEPEGDLGPEVQISMQGNVTADYPSVASCPDGSFVVSWLSMPGGISGLWARSISALGAPLADPFLLSPPGVSLGEYYAVACDANNDVVGTWRSTLAPPSPARNLIQLFSRSGVPLTAARVMDSGNWGTQGTSSILPRADGSMVALWQVYAPPSQLTTVARSFSSALDPTSEETFLPLSELGCRSMDALLLSDDEVAIAFDCYFDGSMPFQIRLTSFALGGPSVLHSFAVEHPTNTGTRGPRIAPAPFSGLVATWSFLESYGAGHLDLQDFDGTLVPSGPAISPDVPEGFSRSEPDVAMSAGGRGLMIWNSYEQDGSIHGVFAQRIRVLPSPIEVPTLSTLGMAMLSAILVGCALASLERRRRRPGPDTVADRTS